MRLYRDPTLLTRRNVWLFFRYVALHAFIIHASLGAIANVRNRMVRSEEYGAILLSDRVADDLTLRSISALAWFGAYPYWTYYFNNRGMKARWFLSAKSGDLKAAVRDPRCQSIVLVGHGSFCLWAATDADVTNDEMTAFMKDQPKKKGEWLQLTCGVPDAWPVKLGELVMDPARVYTYAKSINAYYLVTDALFGFKYIKSLKTRLGSKP